MHPMTPGGKLYGMQAALVNSTDKGTPVAMNVLVRRIFRFEFRVAVVDKTSLTVYGNFQHICTTVAE